MSHGHERKQKNCLNCNTEVHGRFCQNCGQENIEPKESFFGLLWHFFEDITHFDGKFFTTIKQLLLRPGFLSWEFIRGKRVKYLHPVRMYVFTSAVFFLLFYLIGGFEKRIDKAAEDIAKEEKDRNEKIHFLANDYLNDSTKKNNILLIAQLTDTNKVIWGSDSTVEAERQKKLADSLKILLKDEKDFSKFSGEISKEFGRGFRNGEGGRNLLEFFRALLHKMPYVLFVSLPIFAFMLFILYSRNRKWYYFHHAIFSIHMFIYYFIITFLGLLCIKMNNGLGIYLTIFLFFFSNGYTLVAIKNFYGQSWKKSIIKYSLMWFLGFMVFVTVFATFAAYIFGNIAKDLGGL